MILGTDWTGIGHAGLVESDNVHGILAHGLW